MKWITILITLSLGLGIYAQDSKPTTEPENKNTTNGIGNLFDSAKNKNNENKNPTIVTSDTLMIDGKNNIAEFEGNVKVDDDQMVITCDKMNLILEDIAVESTANAKDSAASSDLVLPGGGKTKKNLNRVECIGNVIIIRKIDNALPGAQQKATAGKAVYEMKSGRIVLTQNPILYRGKDDCIGDEIVIWRDSEKMSGKNIKIRMHPQEKNGSK